MKIDWNTQSLIDKGWHDDDGRRYNDTILKRLSKT